MKRLALWICACVALVTVPALAEKKVALVLGNSQYQHATPLPNPTRDAESIAAMLSNLGFSVVVGTDLDRSGMAEKIQEFATKSEDADTVLYYYAGHGLQLGGQNYLVPIDANVNSEMDVKLNTLDIELMLQQTPSTARVKLVLLDACRNNPFKEQLARSMKTRNTAIAKGLAEMKPTFGTLIAYATGPGEVALDGDGVNSPFTTALLKYLPEPGLEIGQAMTRVRAAVYEATGKQQLPWENKNLTSEYYMTAAIEKPDVVASLDNGTVSDAGKKSWTEDNGEIVMWQAVKDSDDVTEIQAYLDQFGDEGLFSGSAKKRIASLEAKAANAAVDSGDDQSSGEEGDIATAEASSATEKALDLNKTDKKILNIKLSSLGFGSRSLGNDFDEQSRMAIAKWQDARGYPVTGYLNQLQYNALLNDDAEVETADPGVTQDPKPAFKKPAFKAEPKFVAKKPVFKPVFKSAPKFAAKKRKPVFRAEPEFVVKKPAKKRRVVEVFDEPPVKKRKAKRRVQADVEFEAPVRKKRRVNVGVGVVFGGKKPKFSISIGGGGGGFGISF